MVRSREEAAKRAEASRTNTPGACQKWTRTLFDAPSAGDQDHDGDADAVDGWKSEPRAARHVDRNPPRGVPVAWSGGSHGYGHRAISLGGGKIRSTDAGGSGRVATVDLDWPEKHWGLRWLGWSDTIDGQAIPDGKPEPSKPAKTTFGIDGSHYQFGNGLSLKAAKKQGYDFVLLKCTQGSHYVDPTYKAALADAKANGYLTAAYHFLEQGDADGQAANLAAHIVDKSVPVAIDVEPDKSSRPTASDWVAFRNACTKRGLKVTLKYLTESYWGEIGKPNLAGPLALWRAAYPSSKHDYASRLYPGNKHSRWRSFGGQTPTLWQFASTGKIDGYSGNVDVNAFRGTRAELAALGLFKDYAAEKPPPPPPPTKTLEFRVHLVPGNKVRSAGSIRGDMGIVKQKTHGHSAVVFNTERESSAARKAVSDGLGDGWTRVVDNEDTIAYGSNWTAAGDPYAVLLAKGDPSKAGVSPRRYLDVAGLKDNGIGVAMCGTHLVSEANCVHTGVRGRKWREKTWPIQVADVLREVKRIVDSGVPVVLAGDFNTGVFFNGKKLFAELTKRFGDKAVHVHNGGLDQVFLVSTDKVRLSEVGTEVVTDNASDHAMVTALIRAEVVGETVLAPVRITFG